MGYIELEKALELLSERVEPLNRPQELPLLEAVGRVACEEVFAVVDQPPFDRSPLDGYALRHEDVAGASREDPATLTVTQRIYAGGCPEGTLNPGQAARIMTGAMLPPGADCVVRQEDTDRGEDVVQIYTPLKKHQNYCFAGEDVRKGRLLIQKGRRLEPAHIGVAAGQGLVSVKVCPRPRVGIISTGDELSPPGKPLAAGKIYDSNGYILSARLQAIGMEPEAERGGDDPVQLTRAVSDMLERCDMILTTGGVSVGAKDFMPEVARMLDAETIFHGVRVKPGSPVLALQKNGKLIICLSGNPFAAVAVFEALVRPVLLKLSGESDFLPLRCKGILQNEFSKPSPSRRLVRARILGGQVTVPEEGHASGMLASLEGCNCMIDVPAQSPGLKKGDPVEVILL